MRRLFWVVVAIVAVAAIAGAVVVMRPDSKSPAHPSLAEVKAALVPLSEMPAGSGPLTFVGGGRTVSCPNSKPRVPPTVTAQANYARRLKLKAHGVHSETIENLFEVVSVYANGTASQRLNDWRALPRCPAAGVEAALGVPQVASDQVSFQQTIPNAGHVDVIVLRVNDNTILSVVGEGLSDTQLVNSTEAFARKAYSRAKNQLGG